MVRKRLDDRVRTLLERSVATGQRSMLVLVGDHGKDQVPNLHHILSRAGSLQARPKVLWCYKKELGFSTHRQKRMKKLKRDKARGLQSSDQADAFDLFVQQTDVTWCYYKDSHRVLGTTVGLLVLQDFEALTPNLMARTIETVQGGGLVVVLLRTVQSLKQLYQMSMDVHARYRTESAGDVVPRFNERFLLSLGNCHNCLVCDDELNVLPLSRKALVDLSRPVKKAETGEVVVVDNDETVRELEDLKESLVDTPHVGVLVDLCKTLDQAKAVLVFLDVCAEKTLRSTVALTAARGRGKSAALGLCLAGSMALGYSTVAVTAPEPENLVSVFDFVLRGLKALKYQEHMDYNITYNKASGRESTKCIVAIHIHRTHRQVIQYLDPSEPDKFLSAEIVAIDEAAAIPLPLVRTLVRQPDQLSFLSSTVNGYEGTGRALSLKLIKELRDAKSGRNAEISAASKAADSIAGSGSNKGEDKVHEQRWAAAAAAVSAEDPLSSGSLREIELETPIRYATGDPIENWLNKLLCLDCGSASNLKLHGGAPAPSECELYSVDRDALFSYHKLSEAFLQKVMGLYTSAHYKNTPNDLQMLSDAPAHALFVLLSPKAEQDANSLPDILAVVQIALEGRISRKAVEAQLARGHRSAGDMIPWTISQQFGDSKFAQLSGARIVRVAVHPSVQGMGYGSRAIDQLYRFYNGEMVSLENVEDDEDSQDGGGVDNESDDSDTENGRGLLGEKLKPRKELPPLLLPLTEVKAPRLDWIGTSFGLTHGLHKFWSRAAMRMLYLRQTKNELTGEHSAIMVRALPRRSGVDDAWLPAFLTDTRRRFIALLGGPFRDVDIRLALSVFDNLKPAASDMKALEADEVERLLTPHDLKRLELYGRNLCDHHLITDLLPTVSRMYFSDQFGPDFNLSSVQAALLCGIGLQSRSVDSLSAELGLPTNQVLAMFNKSMRKISISLNAAIEAREKQAMTKKSKIVEEAAERMRDVAHQTLEDDVAEGADQAMESLKKSELASLPPEITKDDEMMRYVVKGSDEQWKKALEGRELGGTGTIQISSVREKRKIEEEDEEGAKKSKEPKMPSSHKKSKKAKKKSRRSI